MLSEDCRTFSVLRCGLATRKSAFILTFTADMLWTCDVQFEVASETVRVAKVHGGKPQSVTRMCLPIRAVRINAPRHWNAEYCTRSSESKLKMDPHVEVRGKGVGVRWWVLLRLLKSWCEDRYSAFSPRPFICYNSCHRLQGLDINSALDLHAGECLTGQVNASSSRCRAPPNLQNVHQPGAV